jgi:hypothetical protein
MAQEMTIEADVQEGLSTPEGRARFLSRTEPEDPEAYDRWFRAQVRKVLDNPSKPIPHEQVMAEARALVERMLNARP